MRKELNVNLARRRSLPAAAFLLITKTVIGPLSERRLTSQESKMHRETFKGGHPLQREMVLLVSASPCQQIVPSRRKKTFSWSSIILHIQVIVL